MGEAARPERRHERGSRLTPQLHFYRPIKQARSYAPHGARTRAERRSGAQQLESPGLTREAGGADHEGRTNVLLLLCPPHRGSHGRTTRGPAQDEGRAEWGWARPRGII